MHISLMLEKQKKNQIQEGKYTTFGIHSGSKHVEFFESCLMNCHHISKTRNYHFVFSTNQGQGARA